MYLRLVVPALLALTTSGLAQLTTVAADQPANADVTITVEETVTFTATCTDVETSAASLSTTASTTSQCTPISTSLSNAEQVGESILGSSLHEPLSKWLNDDHGNTYKTAPWADRTTKNSDASMDGDVPDTGVTRSYNFTITRGQLSPDGVLRDVILVNNQFPGPAIEANWGDWIEVEVTNSITGPEEGTSMHWHGQPQRDTQWQDGVPGNSQCPIAPGKSLKYRFRAALHGTSWYHAHYSAQYAAGVSGPLIIHGPTSAEYDIDLGPVMLSDWTHIPYFSIVSNVVGTNRSVIPPSADSILINGRGTFDCSKPSYSNDTKQLSDSVKSNITWKCVDDAPKSQFTFTKGKTHRLRLINHGSDGIQKFSIDGHTMKVISVDYVPVVPHETDLITLAVGQRTDIIVSADQASDSAWWMRTSTPDWQTCGGSTSPNGLAAVYYQDAPCNKQPVSASSIPSTSTTCTNDPLTETIPDFIVKPSEKPFIQDFVLTIVGNATGHGEWRINGQTFKADYNDPTLIKAAAGQTDFSSEPSLNVYEFGQNKSIILNITNNTPFPHPFHLHGHNFFVINEGTGIWDGSIVRGDNPMRRDVQIIPGGGFAALQFHANNPGLWPVHCHIAWHLSGGQSFTIAYGTEHLSKPPSEVTQTCADWQTYSQSTVVDQIDSGT